MLSLHSMSYYGFVYQLLITLRSFNSVGCSFPLLLENVRWKTLTNGSQVIQSFLKEELREEYVALFLKKYS